MEKADFDKFSKEIDKWMKEHKSERRARAVALRKYQRANLPEYRKNKPIKKNGKYKKYTFELTMFKKEPIQFTTTAEDKMQAIHNIESHFKLGVEQFASIIPLKVEPFTK